LDHLQFVIELNVINYTFYVQPHLFYCKLQLMFFSSFHVAYSFFFNLKWEILRAFVKCDDNSSDTLQNSSFIGKCI